MAQSSSEQEGELDVRQLLGTLLDNKWLILAVTAVFLVASVAYAILTTPIYQANAVVQVEQKGNQVPGLTAISQTLGASSPESTTQIALITSRSVIGEAVDALNLTVQARPRQLPVIGGFLARHYTTPASGEAAPSQLGLNRYDWGGAHIDLFQLRVPDALLGKQLVLTAGKGGQFSLSDHDGNVLLKGQAGQPASGHGVTIQVKSLTAHPGTEFYVARLGELHVITALQRSVVALEQGKESGIIQLTYDNPDPAQATKLLDQISNFYVLQNVERNSAEAAKSLQFVKEQLPKVRKDLEKATAALNAFQIQAHSVDISLQTKALLDQEVAVETSIQQLRQQQAEMERRFTPEHPAYKALMQQIGQLQAQKAAMEKQVGGLPDTQQELLRLTRDVQVSNQTYTGLLNQAQQLDIERAGTVGNVRVVDTAAVDVSHPVSPKKAAIALGGTFLGAFLAIAFVYTRQMLNRGVEDPAAIEKLGLAVYASIPLSMHQGEIETRRRRRSGMTPGATKRERSVTTRVLAFDDPNDLAVEAIRSLRTSLHFAMLEAKNNVLMICGASPAAGKTFVSTNLAAVVAQAGQKVLLIDADMRRGGLHTVLGSESSPGLSDLLVGKATLESALHHTEVDNLRFISRGHAPPNPSELLMHVNFETLLRGLAKAFDLVIIDTPPILAVTDAAIIGNHVGTSLLVARYGLNQARELALARQRFEQNRVTLKGAIFNAVERRSAGVYAYSYYDYRSAPAG